MALHTYIRFHDGKPFYVGEGSRGRAFSDSGRGENWPAGHNCAVIISSHGDRTASQLAEQGIISWLGLVNLLNIQPYELAATKKNWTRMGRVPGTIRDTPEQRRRKAAAHRGKHWWHKNGETRFSYEAPDETWLPGRK